MTHHGTCVALGERGILLRGPSGAGKSDLALRLIDGGAMLVADDQVLLRKEDAGLLATPPSALAGLIEVRGLGILRLPFRSSILVGLVADLVPREAVPRLPEPAYVMLCEVAVPVILLHAFDGSAVAKLRLAVGTGPSCR